MKWSRWLTWLGIVIALAGVVIAIWLEVAMRTFPFNQVEQRLNYAAWDSPLSVLARYSPSRRRSWA